MKQGVTNSSTKTMESISFQQKSTALSLVITSSAAVYYLARMWAMRPAMLSNNVIPAGFGGLVLTTVVLFILAQVVLQIVLVFGAGSAPEATTKEKASTLKATRNAYLALTFTVFAAVGSVFLQGLTLFDTVSIVILGFATAEMVKFISQLFYAQR